MEFRFLCRDDLEDVLDLFCVCFADDTYYAALFADVSDRRAAMRASFRDGISFCLDGASSIGVREGGRLIGFALVFDYGQVRTQRRDVFNHLFGIREGEPLPYEDSLHRVIAGLPGKTAYLLSLAAAPDVRGRGLAACMLDRLLARYADCNLVSDVSNGSSLGLYEKRGFRVEPLAEDYFFVLHRRNESAGSVDFTGEIRLLVPDCAVLDRAGARYQVLQEDRLLGGFRRDRSGGTDCFVRQEDGLCTGVLVSLCYEDLLRYQRLINLSQAAEHLRGDVLFYENLVGYREPPLFNPTLSEMIQCRGTEWSLIPDVFVSLPVQYLDPAKLPAEAGAEADPLLKNLDFRTHYEAGVPSMLDSVDELAQLKKRIRRYSLGKVRIQISDEMTAGNYQSIGAPIGPAALADLYLSVDTASNCGVLTWYALSCPFLVSHLFDNVIRNQILVEAQGQLLNFYEYIKAEYDLIKRGTPKIFSIFPCSKSRLTDSQLASLLFCETIYPDGEVFGSIIDEDLLAITGSETGMGQYDRAFVCAYTNAIFQFSECFAGSVPDRLCEASITLFYVELILFEEAAIQIADRAIINLFTYRDSDDPVDFLAKVDAIYDDYTKTIDFWDTKVNYPSSQKSIDMLRKAFRIRGQLEEMKRNQEQLQITFQTKSDMVDRIEAKRMNTSLAILSVLAVFSAWIDGHDYIATWSDLVSAGAIRALQRLLFLIVLLTFGYAVTHLFRFKKSARPRKKRTDGKQSR